MVIFRPRENGNRILGGFRTRLLGEDVDYGSGAYGESQYGG
jgi:hypothetical protein